jgi:hypothetical protein
MVTVYESSSTGTSLNVALKSLILRVVADEKERGKSVRPNHPWATVRSRRSHDVEQRLTSAAHKSHRR